MQESVTENFDSVRVPVKEADRCSGPYPYYGASGIVDCVDKYLFDGEYLLRVGTENRQYILGHISLLGYSGRIIAPMTTGGPDEAALGDPIEILLTEWARQCKKQGGVVILPHFPNPRLEHAAAIVGGDIDGVEMTSWGDLYSGINPYSLCDWYRYLNCGYFVAAVGGTDKMASTTSYIQQASPQNPAFQSTQPTCVILQPFVSLVLVYLSEVGRPLFIRQSVVLFLFMGAQW